MMKHPERERLAIFGGAKLLTSPSRAISLYRKMLDHSINNRRFLRAWFQLHRKQSIHHKVFKILYINYRGFSFVIERANCIIDEGIEMEFFSTLKKKYK